MVISIAYSMHTRMGVLWMLGVLITLSCMDAWIVWSTYYRTVAILMKKTLYLPQKTIN